MFFTEEEARTKRAFGDCGRCVNVMKRKDGRTVRRDIATKCIASRCIAWVWESAELLCLHVDSLGNPLDQSTFWHDGSPGSARYYTEEEVPKPTDDAEFRDQRRGDKKGFWVRPNPARLGRCGRLLSTTLMEQP